MKENVCISVHEQGMCACDKENVLIYLFVCLFIYVSLILNVKESENCTFKKM